MLLNLRRATLPMMAVLHGDDGCVKAPCLVEVFSYVSENGDDNVFGTSDDVISYVVLDDRCRSTGGVPPPVRISHCRYPQSR